MPGSSGVTCSSLTTSRWMRLKARAARPVAPRSGGAIHTELVGSTSSASWRTDRPRSRWWASSPSRPDDASSSTLTGTYGRSSTGRSVAAARRAATTSTSSATVDVVRASIVSGVTASVTGTSGTAANPAASAARSPTVVRDRSTVPSGWRAGGAPSSATTATPNGGESSPSSGGMMRWVMRVASASPAAFCATSSTGYTPSPRSGGLRDSCRLPSGCGARVLTATGTSNTRVRSSSPSIDRASSERDRTRWWILTRTLPSAGTPASASRTANVPPGATTGVCATS